MARTAHDSIARFTEGPILGALLTLSVPIVTGNVLQTAYQLTDTFWVGRLGASAVASVSVAYPLIFLLFSLGGGLAVAGSTLVAQHAGARNMEIVGRYAAQTLLMVVSVAALLGLLGFFFAPAILRAMGVGPDVYGDAVRYLRISYVGIIWMFSFAVFQSILRGVGEVKLPLYITLAMFLINLLLDPLLIFGWGPMPAFGVAGAALATFTTQALSTIIGFGLLFGTGRYGIKLTLSDFTPDFQLIKRTAILGFPASIEQSARALGMTVMTFLASSFGTLTLASYGIGSRILGFIVIPALGLSMATATLVGQNIGAGNAARAVSVARLSGTIAFVGLSGIGVLIFVLSRAIVRFFVPDEPELIEAAAQFVRIIALSFGFMGAQQSLLGAFRGAGQMQMTMTLALVSLWVVQFPLAYLLSKHTGLAEVGIWWAFPASTILVTLIAFGLFARGKWHEKRLTDEDRLVDAVSEEIIIEEGLGS